MVELKLYHSGGNEPDEGNDQRRALVRLLRKNENVFSIASPFLGSTNDHCFIVVS
jgi:hypothetical protein